MAENVLEYRVEELKKILDHHLEASEPIRDMVKENRTMIANIEKNVDAFSSKIDAVHKRISSTNKILYGIAAGVILSGFVSFFRV